MPIQKRVICPARLRKVPPQFNWIDPRLVRDKHIGRVSHAALALYLFLLTVADAQGLSYYSDTTIVAMLHLDVDHLHRARQELAAAHLVAYQKPLYQVLSLDEPAIPRQSQPQRIGDIFEQLLPIKGAKR
jgi:hypothetical protein